MAGEILMVLGVLLIVGMLIRSALGVAPSSFWRQEEERLAEKDRIEQEQVANFRDLLIGSWNGQHPDGTEEIMFEKDGTFVFIRNSNEVVSSDYTVSIIDESVVVYMNGFAKNGLPAEVVVRFIQEGKLHLKDGSNETLWTRSSKPENDSIEVDAPNPDNRQHSQITASVKPKRDSAKGPGDDDWKVDLADFYNFYEAFKDGFKPWKNYALFRGRARRREFFYGIFVNFVIFLLISLLDPGLGLPTLYALIVMLPTYALTVRRLHDTGRSFWWTCFFFVPFVGLAILLFVLVQDGEPGANQYGANPKDLS